VSRTFHGRDVFAPVAAHLSRGVPLAEFGPRVEDPVRLRQAHPRRQGASLHGHVVFIDRFGNALTNLTEAALREAFGGVPDDGLVLAVPGRVVMGLARSYGDAPVGAIVAVLGSSGRLEVAQVGGHASERLGLGLGDPVSVRIST
jgi:S-adenosylmethionine hydrolase